MNVQSCFFGGESKPNAFMPFSLTSPSSLLGSLSNDVFERRTSTGSEVFFILKQLDATKFVFLSVFTIIETICPKI